MLSFNKSNCQTNVYYPFPDDDAVWVGREWHYVGNCKVLDDNNLFISGDTIIGPYTYHKLLKNGFMWSPLCPNPPGYYYFGQYWGAFRQEIANKKVYLNIGGVDTLAYDFNLNIGDTMISCIEGYNNLTIYSIDSILIDNSYRKAYWVATVDSSVFTWIIEGIGSQQGAFSPPFYWDEYGNELYCVKVNGQTIYPPVPGYICSLVSIEESNHVENELLVYPNPFSEMATIQTKNYLMNATLSMFNSFGELVKEMRNISGQTILLQRNNLPHGLYYILLLQNNKVIKTSKIIISD
jgi:hypothetical protein